MSGREVAMDEAHVEQVARAIQNIKGGLNYDYADFCRDAARAAIIATRRIDAAELLRAMEQGDVGSGYEAALWLEARAEGDHG